MSQSAHISIPDQVTTEILSKLDTIDLLNCRLVSKSWNQKCLNILRESNKSNSKAHRHRHQCLVKLDIANIQSFVDFVSSPTSSHVALMPSFPWKFELDVYDGCKGPKILPKHCKILDAKLTFLFHLFGPECVDKVTLTDNCFNAGVPRGLRILQVTEFIAKLSAGLTQIVITSISDEFSGMLPQSPRIKLPKLKSFKFCTTLATSWQSYANVVDFICLDNMDNFEEFRVARDRNSWYERLNFSKLAILDVGKVFCAPALLDNLRLSPTLPILQEFSFGVGKLGLDDDDADAEAQAEVQVLIDVLTFLAPTLKSLAIKIYFKWSGTNVNELSLIPLPTLPHLEKFRIDLRHSSGGPKGSQIIYFIAPAQSHFSPETLPALEKVDLPIRSEFAALELEQFPNVQQVTLRTFSDDDEDDDDESESDSDSEESDSEEPPKSKSMTEKRRKEVEKIQLIFPNLSSLTVVKETLGARDYKIIKELVLGIMESSQGTSLQELVIQIGDDEHRSTNILGEILEELDSPFSLTLRNIKKKFVTEEFEKSAREFLKNWTGCIGLGETETSQTEEPGPSVSGDEMVAFTIQQRHPRVYPGIQNVKKIRLEQFSCADNEDRRQGRKTSETYPKWPLSPSEQRKQLRKNRKQIEMMVKYFPGLTQLELSPFFFGQTKRSSCLEEIQELARRFPNLTIHLI